MKGDSDAAAVLPVFEKLQEHLGEGKPAISAKLDPDEKAFINELSLLTMKPYLYIAKCLRRSTRKNQYL